MHLPTAAWQPIPPPKKRVPWKMLGIISSGALALCCGGVLAIGAISGPPDQDSSKAVTAADQAAGQPLPAASDTPGLKGAPGTPPPPTPSLAPTADPLPSPSPSRKTTSKPATAPPKTTKPKPAPTTTRPKPKPTTKAPAAVYYKNCAAVRAAGADPIYRGDPGYGRHLDRDGDGVGCEQ